MFRSSFFGATQESSQLLEEEKKAQSQRTEEQSVAALRDTCESQKRQIDLLNEVVRYQAATLNALTEELKSKRADFQEVKK